MKVFIAFLIFFITPFSYVHSEEVNNLNNLEQSMIKLEKSVEETKSNSESTSTKVNSILEKVNESNIGYDFILSLINSLLAALIFWLIFNKRTEYINKKRIRPKIDLDLYHIYKDLFFVFDTIMIDRNMYSPSHFQKEIKNGCLTKEQIELGLQNKSLNETCLYGVCAHNLIIGKRLYESFLDIDKNIDRIFQFNQYLDTKVEVPLLENIHQNINRYSLNNYADSVHTKIGDQTFSPVTANLNYLKSSMYDLYKLYLQLQALIVDIKKIQDTDKQRDLILDKLSFFYNHKLYRKLKTTIKITKKEPFNISDKRLTDAYDILLAYSKNKKNGYRKLYKSINKQDFHNAITYLYPIMDDIHIQKILLENGVTNENIQKVLNRSTQDEYAKEAFFTLARTIKNQEILHR